MKVKRIERGYTLFLSEHEYAILNRIMGQFDLDKAWPDMPTGERRSWSRRTHNGDFLRTDKDYRIHKY